MRFRRRKTPKPQASSGVKTAHGESTGELLVSRGAEVFWGDPVPGANVLTLIGIRLGHVSEGHREGVLVCPKTVTAPVARKNP